MRSVDVAVIIVSYKSAELTAACLQSIFREQGKAGIKMRAVVVDNASGDFPVIERAIVANDWLSWVTLIAAPQNGGFAYGNNLGIRHAHAERAPDYLFLLNPDTQVRPGAVAALVDFLETHPEVGIAGGRFELSQGEDWPFAFRFPSLVSELTQGLSTGFIERWFRKWTVAQPMSLKAQRVDWISGASMLIRPSALSAVGGLDENYFLYFEETDFCRRAMYAGFSTWYVPESLVLHLIGQSTHSSGGADSRNALPGYWFESRRRFFSVSYGIRRAILIDVIAITCSVLGLIKQTVLGRDTTPHYVRDLIKHSVLWSPNRAVPPVRNSFRLQDEVGGRA
jgi:N-acetylglucosaminyl-diphospho-decaprenol L-rhamnosyltransferase